MTAARLSSRSPTPTPDRTIFWALAITLAVALGLGGGGSWFGLANLMVQLAAIAALALGFESVRRFWRESPLSLRLLCLAALALPLLQIIPLPASIWAALPGRELVTRALETSGNDPGEWMTLSLDPRRTLLAFTALITPLALLAGGWSLSRERLITLGWLAVALGLALLVLGVVQATSPQDTVSLFDDNEAKGVLRGTLANRNSTALLLGFILALAALLPPPAAVARRVPMLPWLRAALCGLMLLAIILTQSRTGLVLAAIPVLLAIGRAAWEATATEHGPGRPISAARRAVLVGAAALSLLGIGGAALVATAPGRISETLARFEARDDPRRFIWDDATYAIARYWPVGAGQGTFDEVFQVDESLENLTQRRAGRAHNDYLELAMEAGLAGLVLAGAWLVLLAWLSWRARRSSLRWAGWAGSSFLLAIALQSITDYPMRNQTMLAFAGLALLLLARASLSEGDAR